MMLSMTAFASSEIREENFILEGEIKSYNNRFLDISFSLSSTLSKYEAYIKKEIEKKAQRGHIEFRLRLKSLYSQSDIIVDKGLLKAYKKAIEEVSSEIQVAPISASDLLSIPDIIKLDNTGSEDIYEEAVKKITENLLSSFYKEKIREGEGTRKDLERLADSFSSALSEIEENQEELEENFKEILFAKFNELMETKQDDPRVLSEVASLLVKYSINEEVSRLKIHLEEFYKLLDAPLPVGRRLDFLSQEMNRECNTIASKSQKAKINLLVVKMKDDLENIKEQIRNIE